MSKDNEISATEKLLEMIRGEKSPPPSNNRDRNNDIKISVEDNGSDSLSELTLESSAPLEPTTSSNFEPASKPTVSEDIPANNKSTISPTPDIKKDILRTPTTPAFLGILKNTFSKLCKFKVLKIGIDLQDDQICIATLEPNQNILHKTDFLAVSIPPLEGESSRYEDPEFIQFLKKQIEKCRKSSSKYEIWCSYHSDNTEILTIIIPKVPKNEIPNAVFWSTKKETELDLSEYVFDFSVQKEIKEGKQKKIITTVYLLPRKELNGLKNIFRKAGLQLTGVTLPSSAIQNLSRSGFLSDTQETSVHLTLKRDMAHIDIYYKTAMLFTRKIKTGINSLVESVFDKAAEQDLILDDQSAINLLFTNSRDTFYASPSKSKQEIDELEELLSPADLPVTARLSSQLNRTFDYCSTNFKIPRANSLHTSGPYSLKKTILDQLMSELDINCHVITLALEDSILPVPENISIPENFDPVPAFGLALSDKELTQNFLYTFADKKKFVQETLINKGIACLTIILAVVCGIFFFMQYKTVQEKQDIVKQLESKLENRYTKDPRSRDTSFSQMAIKKIQDTLQENVKTAQRFRSVAAINIILRAIPQEIKLTDLDVQKVQGNNSRTKSKSHPQINLLNLKGIVRGIPKRQEFILLDFQKKLYNLPIINDVTILTSDQKNFDESNILYFTMSMHTSRDIFK